MFFQRFFQKGRPDDFFSHGSTGCVRTTVQGRDQRTSTLRRLWMLLATLVVMGLGGWAPTASAFTCSATVSPMNFSNLGFLSTSVDTSSTILVSCQKATLDVVTTIQVCPLIGPSVGGGTGSNRALASTMGHPALRYGLFSDSARATTWGNFTNAPYPSVSMDLSSGNLVTQTFTVYGRVFGPQTPVGNDSYQDSPTVSLAYAAVACNLGVQTSVGPLVVMATAVPTCTLSVAPLNFGSMGLLQAVVDGVSNVQTACTQGTAYTISMGDGNYPGATAATRAMVSGANALKYSLYTDAARSNVWGDAQTLKGTGTGGATSIPVYARIPVQPSPPPGLYQDQVVVTIAY